MAEAELLDLKSEYDVNEKKIKITFYYPKMKRIRKMQLSK